MRHPSRCQRVVRPVLGAFIAWAALWGLSGCGSEPAIPLDRPHGWLSDERGSWWVDGVDTARAFPDLESFASMGLERTAPVYSVDQPAESRRAVGEYRLLEAVRSELLPLIRNHPSVVDSLFWKYVADNIRPDPDASDARVLVQDLRRNAYRTLMRHFRAPATTTILGRDIPVAVPDSLREIAAGRAVTFQIYVDADGRTAGIRQLEGIHPILDRIALRAVTQTEWQPAYVLRGGRARAIDGWVRFGVRFPGSAGRNGSP